MIFERLQIERFGHLADVEWGLGPGLHVICGLNEAGKTTALQAIRALLYRIPERDGWNYAYAKEDLAIRAGLRFRDGTLAQVKRTYGRARSLQGTLDGAPLDEDGLNARIGASRDLFVNVFGFSLEEMQQGGQALAYAGVQETLYGIGLGGGVDISRIQQGLAEEAEALFKPQGQLPAVNRLCAHIEELRRQRSGAELRAADYRALQKDLSQAQADADEINRRLEGKAAELGMLERAKEIGPLLASLEWLREQRAWLFVPVGFSPGDGQRVGEVLVALRKHEAVSRALEDQTRELQAEIEAIGVDDAVLDAQEGIDALYRGLDRIKAHLDDLPTRRREAEDKDRAVRLRLEELGPEWDMDRLRSFQVSRGARQAVEQLAEEHPTVSGDAQRAAEDVANLVQQIQETQQSVAALATPADVTVLRDRLEGWAAFEVQRRQLCEADGGLAVAAKEIEGARRALDPPLTWSDGGMPEALPVPSIEEVEEQRGARQKLDDRLERLQSALQEVEEQRRLQAEELEQQRAALELPSPDDLRQARGGRDAQWRCIREWWLTGVPVEDPGRAADTYEAEVVRADAVSDRLREHAQEVAHRQRGSVELRQLEERGRGLRRQLEELERATGVWGEAWAQVWARTGLVPDAPGPMLDWLRRHADLRKLCRERDARLPRRDGLQAEVAQYERALRAAVGCSPERTLEAVRREGALRCQQAEALTQQEQALRRDLAALHKRHGEQVDAEREAASALAAWHWRWEAALANVGLAHDMDVRAAETLLSDVRELQAALADLDQANERVVGISEDLAGYQHQRDVLADRLDVALKEADLVAAIGMLQRRKQTAVAAATRKQKLEEQREAQEAKLRQLDEERAPLAAERVVLLSKAEATDEAALERVAADVQRAAELDAKARDTQERIAALRRSCDDAEVLDALAREAPEVLAPRMEQLGAVIGGLKDELAAQQQKVGEARAAVRRHDGTSQAAALEQELQSTRANLAADARRYAVLQLAQALLAEEMGRFEADHQPALLQRAGAFFERLTGGRYVAVRRRLGSDELAAVDGAETMLAPDKLSTGTRQQLYLALRLAYIDHYARQSEPLPVVLDDVLVNFDAPRATAALETLGAFSGEHQVLFLTCHEHLVELAQRVRPGLRLLQIG